MPYRDGSDAIGRATQRLAVARERLAAARADVEREASGLSDARRKLELARLHAGAAAASVRHVEASIAAERGDRDHGATLAETEARLEAARAEIPTSERAVDERRAALRRARRELGALDHECQELERELRRLRG